MEEALQVKIDAEDKSALIGKLTCFKREIIKLRLDLKRYNDELETNFENNVQMVNVTCEKITKLLTEETSD